MTRLSDVSRLPLAAAGAILIGVALVGCGTPSPAGTVARGAAVTFSAPLVVRNALAVPVVVRVASGSDNRFWWDPDGAVPTSGPPVGLNGTTIDARSEAMTMVAYDTRCAFTRNGRQPARLCGPERAWFAVTVAPPAVSPDAPVFELNLKDTGTPRTGPRWGPRKLPESSSAGCSADALTLLDQRFTYTAADGATVRGIATVTCLPYGWERPDRGKRTTITIAPA